MNAPTTASANPGQGNKMKSQGLQGEEAGADSGQPPETTSCFSSLRRFRSCLGAFLRWSYVLLLFVYLFALVDALFEAHGFQQLVSHLISTKDDLGGTADEYRRRVVLVAVKEAHRLAEWKGRGQDPGPRQALLDQVAVRVAVMQGALKDLSEIDRRFRLERVQTTELPSAKRELERLVGQLQRSTERLGDAALQANAGAAVGQGGDSGGTSRPAPEPPPSVAAARRASVVHTLMEMHRALGSLVRLGPGRDDEPGRRWHAATTALESALDSLIREVSTGRSDRASTEAQLDAVQAFRDALKPLADPVPLLTAAAPASPLLGGRAPIDPACIPATWLKSMEGPWKDLKLYDRDERVPLVKVGLSALGFYQGNQEDRQFDKALAEAVVEFRQPSLTDKPSIIDEQFRGRLLSEVKAGIDDRRIALRRAGGTCPSPAERLVADLGTQLDVLKSAVSEGDLELQLLQRVYAPIARLSSAVAGLDGLTVAAPEAAEAGAATAKGTVEKRLGQLRDALAELGALLDAEGTPVQIVARAIGDNVPDSGQHAETILGAYRDLGRFQAVLTPFQGLSSDPNGIVAALGFRAKSLAVAGTQIVDLMVVFVMGAIGSLIYITQYLLRNTIHGRPLNFGAGRSFAWFVFRPIFGVVVAFAIYLIYKAGQIALGAGTGTDLSSEVNLPMLSSLALYAGLMSWQVLERVEEQGRRLFSAARRGDLWATGLKSALDARDISVAELSGHLGVTNNQVQRWFDLIDRVTPEMQDRIAAWLGVAPVEIFSSEEPTRLRNRRKAYCLAQLMKERGLDAAQLALRLGVSADVVNGWAKTETEVAPNLQDDLVVALGTSFGKLFCPEGTVPSSGTGAGETPSEDGTEDLGEGKVDATTETPLPQEVLEISPLDPSLDPHPRWAVGLRPALWSYEGGNSDNLADVLEVEASEVRAWMELDSPVPEALQEALIIELEAGAELFAEARPTQMLVIADPKLFRDALARHPACEDLDEGQRLIRFAAAMDVEPDRLRRWLEERLPMAPETAKRLLFELEDSVEAEALLDPV